MPSVFGNLVVMDATSTKPRIVDTLYLMVTLSLSLSLSLSLFLSLSLSHSLTLSHSPSPSLSLSGCLVDLIYICVIDDVFGEGGE